MITQRWYFGVAACERVNTSGSRNVHTSCKLQCWSSDQCASLGVSVSDIAKCASRALCMHSRFQRCFGSQPSIIQQASTLGFIHSQGGSCLPAACVVCLLERGWNFDFGPKTSFFYKKTRCTEYENPTSAPLIVLVVTITNKIKQHTLPYHFVT